MRKARKTAGGFMNLDSLVDIVSNNVGILVILAAFMALFALVNPNNPATSSQETPREQPPAKILVPWSHPTVKHPIYFVVRGHRVQYLDLRPFFLDLAERTPDEQPGPITFEEKGVRIRFFPVTNQVYCLEFTPRPRAGETWFEAQRADSVWQEVLRSYPRENFVFFFWVSGDSFEMFRQMRKFLWGRQYEIGWKPALKSDPLEVCSGFETSAAFQPQ